MKNSIKKITQKKGGKTSRCWNAKTKTVLESGCTKVSKTATPHIHFTYWTYQVGLLCMVPSSCIKTASQKESWPKLAKMPAKRLTVF